MIILGIDPGSWHTGYGVIEVQGNKSRVLEYDILHLNKTHDHELRLKNIYDRITQVIERHLPDECAIEMPVYGRNPQSMLKLGRAQAAAMLAALNRGVPIAEYTPKEVKKSVTGNGNASKEQVWYMVQAVLSIPEGADSPGLDASDALATSLCHAHRLRQSTYTKGQITDWKSFLQANPGRLAP